MSKDCNHVTQPPECVEVTEEISSLIDELVSNTVPQVQRSQSESAIIVAEVACPHQRSNQDNEIQTTSASTSGDPPPILQPLADNKQTVEIYHTSRNFNDSQSEIELGFNAWNTRPLPTVSTVASPPSVPPSYSSVIKQPRGILDLRREVRSMELQHISPFARIPPPSYGEIHGIASRTDISISSSEQMLFGPDPIYIYCSRCGSVVVTATYSQRTKFTHCTAATLCLFGCWPCAMMPYLMNSCKNIYHYCPDCHHLFGTYRPW